MEMLTTYRLTPSIAQNMLSSLDALTAKAKDLRSEVKIQSERMFTQEEAVGIVKGLNELASNIGQTFESLIQDIHVCENALKVDNKFVAEVIQHLEEYKNKNIVTIRAFLNSQTNPFCTVDQMAKKVSREKTCGNISPQGVDANSKSHGLLYFEEDLQRLYDEWAQNVGQNFGRVFKAPEKQATIVSTPKTEEMMSLSDFLGQYSFPLGNKSHARQFIQDAYYKGLITTREEVFRYNEPHFYVYPVAQMQNALNAWMASKPLYRKAQKI